jgi:transaldolase
MRTVSRARARRDGGDGTTVSPIKRLLEFGQSPWLDFIQRSLLKSGELTRMIDEWGVRGVTSNPVIFEKAIAHTDDYRAEIAHLARASQAAEQIYKGLAIEDVRAAAELLDPIYRASGGTDGFVSLEVSPRLARDAPATIAEAKQLWSALDRPNVMIKVPGTAEGLTAIRSLLADGVNVNVTLLFSIDRYREVLEAYLAGLEDAFLACRPIDRIVSVASFFLSRIDTLIDAELDVLAAANAAREREAKQLRGTVAIASARLAYGIFEEGVASERFRRLRAEGAQAQRLLWASTGTKDPAYSPIKYVDPLIGANTVNTMPLETLEAYHALGQPKARLSGHASEARDVLAALAGLGIDLDAATARLLDEGIEKFVRPYESLLRAIESERNEALGGVRNRESHGARAEEGRT